MKMLFYEWESYLQYDIKWICKELNIALETFSWKFTDKNEDEKFETWFAQSVDTGAFDAILSVNYWPMLSKVAQKNDIRYIAWCYDNPLNVIRPEDTLGNSVNAVFFFDRVQAAKYINAGFDTVHYLPLGVNVSRLGSLQMSASDCKQYSADVSLVGSLYESPMYTLRGLMDDYRKGYLDAVMAAQQNLYGCYLFDDAVTDEMVTEINQYIKTTHPESDFHLLKEALTFAMASEVTRKDRLMLLAMLGKRFDTRLYSFQNSEILADVKCFPPVDYVTEMPKVFACSKINLNPVLRCIQSGIPLRALDVMAAGGFLLSSYQAELMEQFVYEEEMVVYESIQDAVEKADFYLKHDDIRMQIAAKGRKKVLEQYSLKDRFLEILEIAGITDQKLTVRAEGGMSQSQDCSYYVVCPAGIASGGPELAHQFCYELNQSGTSAKMLYMVAGKYEPVDMPVLEKYERYCTSHVTELAEVERQDAIMVHNESMTRFIPYYPTCRKVLWWMSVDNYLKDTYRLSHEELKKQIELHLVQSQYAYDYVKTHMGVEEEKIIFLSDYIHEAFYKRYFPDGFRENIVLYNPKKGLDNLQPLIDMTPEVKWIPLVNLSEEQLIKIMQIAKVYIDLGNHPGKDRIPREAVLGGCCIITNKQGSAAFQEDVPILEKYKFEHFAEQYEDMKALILDICDNYDEHSKNFNAYRQWIAGERSRFTQDTLNVVQTMK